MLAIAAGILGGLLSVRNQDVSKGGGVAHRRSGSSDSAKEASTVPTTKSNSDTMPVPRFTHARIAAPKTVENDPSSPDYDAVALSEITGAPLGAVFSKEPKNPKWSPHVEEQFRFFFSHDFEADGLRARVRSVDCRSRICELVVEADTDDDLKQANHLLQYTPIANVFQPNGRVEPGPAYSFLFAFSGKYRDVVGWNVTYPQRRNMALAQLRAKARNAPPEQLANVPAVPPDVPPPAE